MTVCQTASDWTSPATPISVGPHDAAYVIGDVHGRWDLLEPMLRRLALLSQSDRDPRLFSVGDLIDRGPDGLRCIEAVHSYPGMECLPGNHEQLMVAFLESGNAEIGGLWARNGGYAVMDEAGRMAKENGWDEACPDHGDHTADVRALILKALGARYQDIKNLPPYRRVGNVMIVHAGVPQDETPATMAVDHEWTGEAPMLDLMHGGDQDDSPLWVRHAFLTREDAPWPDGTMVVHGHTIMRNPVLRTDRISIDTGAAKADGSLTMLEIRDGMVRFHQAWDA